MTRGPVDQLRDVLDEAGLDGAFLVRDLDSGAEIGIAPDAELPLASVIKVPLALATLTRIADGELDGATTVEVSPGRLGPGLATGITCFRHPATVAVADLLYLAVGLSDNAAADALFDLTPPGRVNSLLRGLGVTGITARHRMDLLTHIPVDGLRVDDHEVGPVLAATAVTDRGGSVMPQLDVARASVASPRALVGLLDALWNSTTIRPGVAATLRGLMAANVHRQRLHPEFATDASSWASKTGTLLNLRHEIGVVEHATGGRYAVAALTRSRIGAAAQPAAEIAIGYVARELHDHLRAGH